MGRPTAAVILAAGQGKRMKSKLPKVLHPCGGVPLVAHAVSVALARKCNPVVVVIDSQGTRVRELLAARFPDAPLKFGVQRTPRGTGDAARVGLEAIPNFSGRVLIIYGDVPLLRPETVARLERAAAKNDVAFLTAVVDNPNGYGRVVREGRRVVEIVEHKDATKAQRDIQEINAGVYLTDGKLLRKAVGGLKRNNKQKELYLTDVVEQAAKAGGASAVVVDDFSEVQGVNTRMELARAEQALRLRLVAEHMDRGVTFLDPDNTFIDATVRLDKDVVIGVGVQLRGRTRIGPGARIEGPSVVIDSQIARGATVHAFSHVERALVGADASVGPYGRLRPEAELEAGSRVGNFVEVKKARIGKGAKANHLAYIGDATVGAGSNVGAGTITCNYDGAHKHRTELGKGVFVGSNSTLVAPLNVGDGAYIAAGSTITKEVPEDALSFGRARQSNRDGYAERIRQRQAAAKRKG